MINFLEKFKKLIGKIENSKVSFSYFILTFLFIFFIRNVLEYFSNGTSFDFLFHLECFLWYLSILISFVITVNLITKKDVFKVLKVGIFGFITIFIAPILDLLLGSKMKITYILPEMSGSLLLRYLTYFGHFSGPQGVSLGIKIELLILLFGFSLYIFVQTKSYVRSMFGLIIGYSVLFFFGALPTLVNNFCNFFSINFLLSTSNLVRTLSVILSILFIILIYFYNKNYFKLIVKDLRITRILFYLMIFFFGIVISADAILYKLILSNYALIINFLLCIFAIFFAIMFSLFTNNLVDIKMDSVTNKERPLIKNEICLEHYKNLSWLFLFISLILAYSVDYVCLVLILVFIGGYYLYSMPPFRLKRIPFLSKFIIAFNILTILIIGIYYATAIVYVPIEYAIMLLIFFPFLLNFIDIKDYHGDKKVGIKTIPILLGLKLSKILIGISFMISYMASYFLFDFYNGIYSFIGLVIISLAHFIVINKKNYSDQHVFFVILPSVLFIIFNVIF